MRAHRLFATAHNIAASPSSAPASELEGIELSLVHTTISLPRLLPSSGKVNSWGLHFSLTHTNMQTAIKVPLLCVTPFKIWADGAIGEGGRKKRKDKNF